MEVSSRSITLRNKILPALYLVGVSACLYAILAENGYDDPFITYRYAHNLAQGHGFVFNPGERVLSTTTPLFTLILAALNFITPELPRLANFIGAVSLALSALFIWDLSKTWKTPEVGWAALLLYPTFTLPATTLGSETPLYITFCLAAFAFYARQKYSHAAVFAALATLTRPDGILVAVILAAHYLLFIRRPVPWKTVLLFVAILIPWFLFAWLYFGYPIPVTLAAKQHQGALGVGQQFARGFLSISSWYVSRWQYWVEIILAVLGFYWLVRKSHQWSLVLSWTALYFIAYCLLRVPRYFWYYAPLVPGLIILVGLGIAAITYWIREGSLPLHKQTPTGGTSAPVPVDRLAIRRERLSKLAAGFLLILLAVPQALDIWQLKLHPDGRAAIYRDVGYWLEANTAPDTLIGSLEAGIIGYYSGRPIVDFAGLFQPEVAQQIVPGSTYDDAALWAMENYSPEYVVLIKGDLRRLKQTYLDERCEIVQRFSEAVYKSMAVNIYLCR